MDIERFKRLSIPKIEAGKMTEVVRDVIKEVETRDQDFYEKVAKDLKPLTDKFDKEIEEISKLREDVNKQVVPYAEQVQRLALPGPSGEVAPKMVADMNKGFTQEELAFIQWYSYMVNLLMFSNILYKKASWSTLGKEL